MSDVSSSKSKLQKKIFLISTLGIIAAFILTLLSFYEFCTTSCVEGHKYRLFNIKFEIFGLAFFGVIFFTHLLGYKFKIFKSFTGLSLSAAVGAELCFIYYQKYIIGSWCPVCLGIAASVGLAALTYLLDYFVGFKKTYKEGKVMMNHFKCGFSSLSSLVIGFAIALAGITKVNATMEAQGSLKESIAFGNQESPIEVYVFTDWFCPACEKIEPVVEKAAPKIEKEAKLFFVDAYIHDESMNFTPYNLSFMIYNKPEYFKLRHRLSQIAHSTKSPSDSLVEKSVLPLGVELNELNYRDIAVATKMFRKLKQQFGVSSTPSIVVINLDTKKGRKLTGAGDITEPKIFEAIRSLQ
ncbi:MAG: thioredoxin domain-containing protein [Chlamydiota bacterium]|nr:thioredoxin domain-containing protein [Chlamydiota bacterium]